MAEKVRLSRTFIDKIPLTASKESRIDFADSEIPGLTLRVGLRTKVFYLTRRDKVTKKLTKLKLGTYPEITPEDARLKVMKLLSGGEGIARAAAFNEAETIDKLWDLYWALQAKDKLKSSTQEIYQWIWNKHVSPEWGSLSPRDVTRKMIRDKFTTYSKTSKSQADKLLVVLSSVFTFALKNEIVEFNPVSVLGKNGNVRRKNRVQDHELKPVADLIDSFPPLYQNILWLFLLLGQRRSETALMEWSEINFKTNVWTIPGDDILGVNKGKTKNRLTHTVPLPPLALSKILDMKKYTGSEQYVFWNDALRWNKEEPGPISPPTLTKFLGKWFRTNKPVGFRKFTIHDLRRTAYSGMTALTERQDIVERVVNHIKTSDASFHYDYHHYNGVKLEALTAWERHVLAQLERS